MKKVALCFSGHCRTLDKTIESIKTRILKNLKDYDIFMYLPEDEDTHKHTLLDATKIKIVKDNTIDEKNLIPDKTIHAKKGVQAYLQQLKGMYQVNELRKEYEIKNNITYDVIIRIRLDTLFITDLPPLYSFDINKFIYIPNFHHWKGYNDRFAIGNRQDMDVYFSLYKRIFNLTERIEGETNDPKNPFGMSNYTGFALHQNPIPFLTNINNCEMYLKVLLDVSKINVKPFNFYFNRVRVGGNLLADAPMVTQGNLIFRTADSINQKHNHKPLA